jgi:hypothetical protein
MVAWYDWEVGWYCILRENRGRLDLVKTELTHVMDNNSDSWFLSANVNRLKQFPLLVD